MNHIRIIYILCDHNDLFHMLYSMLRRLISNQNMAYMLVVAVETRGITVSLLLLLKLSFYKYPFIIRQ